MADSKDSQDRSFGDAQKLHGTTYRTRSGNVVTFEFIGRGGLRCMNHGGPLPEADKKEVNEYLRRVLNSDLFGGKEYGKRSKASLEAEIKDYQEFLKGNEGDPIL